MKTRTLSTGLRRWLFILLFAQAPLTLTACGYVAAGAVGAAVGHEVAEEDDEEE